MNIFLLRPMHPTKLLIHPDWCYQTLNFAMFTLFCLRRFPGCFILKHQAQKLIEAVFDASPWESFACVCSAGSSSGSSLDEAVQERVSWLEKGQSSDSDFRQDSVPYPRSLRFVRSDSGSDAFYMQCSNKCKFEKYKFETSEIASIWTKSVQAQC